MNGQGTWKNTIGVKDVWGKSMCIDLSEWAKTEDTYVSCERMTSIGEDFYNQLGTMSCSLASSQTLSSATPVIYPMGSFARQPR
jgi:hypothetical protein